nr:formin-like protein 5 [Lolium perenne]
MVHGRSSSGCGGGQSSRGESSNGGGSRREKTEAEKVASDAARLRGSYRYLNYWRKPPPAFLRRESARGLAPPLRVARHLILEPPRTKWEANLPPPRAPHLPSRVPPTSRARVASHLPPPARAPRPPPFARPGYRRPLRLPARPGDRRHTTCRPLGDRRPPPLPRARRPSRAPATAAPTTYSAP